MSKLRTRIARTATAATLIATALVAAPISPASAVPAPLCTVNGSSLVAARPAVERGRAVRIFWHVTLGSNCQNAVLLVNNQVVPLTGNLLARLTSDRTFNLVVQDHQGSKQLRSTTVRVFSRHSEILTQLTGFAETRVAQVRQGQYLADKLPGIAGLDHQVLATADFDRDGSDDILWMAPVTRDVYVWKMHNGTRMTNEWRGSVPAGTTFQATGDFGGNGFSDILWRNAEGFLRVWNSGVGPDEPIDLVAGQDNTPNPDWQVIGTGDFNGDGDDDILWRHTNGQMAIHYMNGTQRIGEAYPGGQDPSLSWKVADVADFDADGFDDILWRHSGGSVAIWFKGLDSLAAYPSYHNAGGPVGLEWALLAASDVNADSKADLLWRRTDGTFAFWLMNGAQFVADTAPKPIEGRWVFSGFIRSAY